MKVIYKFFSILLNLLFNDKSNFLLIFVVIIILYICTNIYSACRYLSARMLYCFC